MASESERADAAVRRLRSIGYPCGRWSSPSGKRHGVVIDSQAAERLIQVHQPGFRLPSDQTPTTPTTRAIGGSDTHE